MEWREMGFHTAIEACGKGATTKSMTQKPYLGNCDTLYDNFGQLWQGYTDCPRRVFGWSGARLL